MALQPAQRRCPRKKFGTWDKIVKSGVSSFRDNQPEQFERCLRRGIPVDYRWPTWKALLLTEGQASSFQEQLSSECTCDLLASKSAWNQKIEQDVPGTMPHVRLFTPNHEVSLCRVLNAYANLNPEVGYRQGMSFVVAVLLLVSSCSEEEALWAFVCLMEDRGLSGFYKEGFPLLHDYVEATSQLMDEQLPELVTHFQRLKLRPSEYLTRWFQALFVSSLPLPTVLIILDSIICNGLHTLLQTSISLLSSMKDVLLGLSYEEILVCFKSMRTCTAEADAVWIARRLMRQSVEWDKTRRGQENDLGVAPLHAPSAERSVSVLKQARHDQLKRLAH